jgi:phosphate:Na+ symporter
LQRETLEPGESARLGQIIPAIRNAVHSAKSIKDVRHNLAGFRDSANDRFNAYASHFQESTREFYEAVAGLAHADLEPLKFEALISLRTTSEKLHEKLHERIYDEVARSELSQVEISTLLNVNREMYVSNQSLISALTEMLLSMEAADDLESVPATR